MPRKAIACLDLEDLAAFADGRLSGAEREQAVKHLADCERCYDIFGDVVHLQEEQAQSQAVDDPESDQLATVVEHPSARRWLWPSIGALSAAAVVLLVATPLLRDHVLAPPPQGWDEHSWSELRSGDGGRRQAEAAFRLGVRSVDFALALEAGRGEHAEYLTHRLESLLKSFEFSEAQISFYQAIRKDLEAEVPPGDLLAAAVAAEGLLQKFVEPPQLYRFGQWLEEARAAALKGDRKFYKSARTRRVLGEVEDTELPRDAAEEFERARSLIADGPEAEDLPDLERSLARIIKLGGTR